MMLTRSLRLHLQPRMLQNFTAIYEDRVLTALAATEARKAVKEFVLGTFEP